jgi:hypothetical protein
MTQRAHDEESPEFVWVLGLAGDDDDGEDLDRGIFFRRQDARIGRQPVPTGQLKENVTAFVKAMGEALAGVPAVLAGYSIETIEISTEISATGKVSLLGNGVDLTGTGGISFTLTPGEVQRGRGARQST